MRSEKPRNGLPGVRNRVEWFSVPAAASALRTRVIQPATSSVNWRAPAIGFLQRGRSRRVTNFDKIEAVLAATVANATFDTVCFETMPFANQTRWMSSHDVVIAAHGAGLTNAAFIRPCAIVMELFPPNYYVSEFYQPLIQQAGGIALEWHNGSTPEKDRKLHWGNRSHVRRLDFAPDVAEVACAITSALKSRCDTDIVSGTSGS